MLVVTFDLGRVLSYVTPYVLHDDLRRDMRTKSGYPFSVNMDIARDIGIILHKRYGFNPEPFHGVCKVVYVHERAVLKLPITQLYAQATEDEVDFINKQPTALRKYLPYTIHMGNGISIQERCVLDKGRWLMHMEEIIKAADELQQFDYHWENVGFSLDGEYTPKFIDVQTEVNLGKVMACGTTHPTDDYRTKTG